VAADYTIGKNFFIEGGYITKSPCRDCICKTDLPVCSTNCLILSQIQNFLASTLSCPLEFSDYEDYSVALKLS